MRFVYESEWTSDRVCVWCVNDNLHARTKEWIFVELSDITLFNMSLDNDIFNLIESYDKYIYILMLWCTEHQFALLYVD